MKQRVRPAGVFLLVACLMSGIASATVALPRADGRLLGTDTSYMREASGRLDIDQAVAAYRHGAFVASHVPAPDFGIGSSPVWLHVDVDNTTAAPLERRLSIDTAWLDHIDVYVLHAGHVLAAYRTGDRVPFAQRPVRGHGFVFPCRFPPGHSEIMVRVATPDPMLVPMVIDTPAGTTATETGHAIGHAFLYGFLCALLGYNLMLSVGLRALRYGLYALYLGAFMLMNFSYSGYAYEWLWPSRPGWAQWSQVTLMMLFASCGLLFALNFLRTRRHFPRLHRAALAYMGSGALMLVLATATGWQAGAAALAFAYVTLFTAIMLLLGMLSVRTGLSAGRYFLMAAACSMVGTAVTALAVWGVIPFNTLTYHAIDLGMVLEATLLALALSYQFREGEQRRVTAEHLARVDPLTGLNNRRAFYDLSRQIWNIALRHRHGLCVILLDLDRFKRVNDEHGHACGDQVLKATADVLKSGIRQADVMARWGGEEFIILLPDIALAEATALAERLRAAVEAARPTCQGRPVPVSASFGVAEMEPCLQSLDALISRADQQLYRAKRQGRNRVCHGSGPVDGEVGQIA